MTRFTLFALLLASLVVLNMFAPEQLSIDPWLCRSVVGAKSIRNWGWPQFAVTEFNEISGDPESRIRLTSYSGLILNLIAAGLILAVAGLLFRSRNPYHTMPQND